MILDVDAMHAWFARECDEYPITIKTRLSMQRSEQYEDGGGWHTQPVPTCEDQPVEIVAVLISGSDHRLEKCEVESIRYLNPPMCKAPVDCWAGWYPEMQDAVECYINENYSDIRRTGC